MLNLYMIACRTPRAIYQQVWELPGQPPMSPIKDVLADLQTTSRWQERVYKQLHAHPELSFQETETAALADDSPVAVR